MTDTPNFGVKKQEKSINDYGNDINRLRMDMIKEGIPFDEAGKLAYHRVLSSLDSVTRERVHEKLGGEFGQIGEKREDPALAARKRAEQRKEAEKKKARRF